MTEGIGVYKAIVEVTSAMAKEGISKTRKNQQQGYSFRGIDDVYNVLGGMLAEARLCIIPRVLSRQITEKQTKTGSPLFYVVVDVEYDLVSADDGSKHLARAIGEAMDSADKATNKAMSAAYKYMAFQTFAIPTEGDNDADLHTHELRHRNPPPPTPAQKSANVAKAKAAIAPRPPIEGTATTVSDSPFPPEAGDLSGVCGTEPEKPDHDTLKNIVAAFARIGYDIEAMEKEYGKRLDDWTMDDVPEAREVYKVLLAQHKAAQDQGDGAAL